MLCPRSGPFSDLSKIHAVPFIGGVGKKKLKQELIIPALDSTSSQALTNYSLLNLQMTMRNRQPIFNSDQHSNYLLIFGINLTVLMTQWRDVITPSKGSLFSVEAWAEIHQAILLSQFSLLADFFFEKIPVKYQDYSGVLILVNPTPDSIEFSESDQEAEIAQ